MKSEKEVNWKIWMLSAALLPVLVGCGEKNPEAVAAATPVVEEWLSLIDNGEYSQAWQEGAKVLQDTVSEQEFAKSVRPVREPLGNVEARTLRGASYTTSLPGAPDGEYVVIQYETDFANKEGAVETITPMLDEDGQWRVSGYYIK